MGNIVRACSQSVGIMDIKFLQENYILKKWTQDARSDMVEDCYGRSIVENPKLDVTHRYRSLAQKLLNLAAIVADYEEVSDFVDYVISSLSKEVDKKNTKSLKNQN
jgi:hypothetical protein